MSNSGKEPTIKELTAVLANTGNSDNPICLLGLLQAKSAEVQQATAIAAKRNARYMFWSVIFTAISATITAIIAYFIFYASPQQSVLDTTEPGRLIILYKQPPNGLINLNQKEIAVDAVEDTENKAWRLHFNFVLQNAGDEPIVEPILKLYSNNASILENTPSADEPKYQFEEVIQLKGILSRFIPGKFTFTSGMTLGTFKNDQFSLQREPLLMKLYYGKGEVATATAFLTKKSQPR